MIKDRIIEAVSSLEIGKGVHIIADKPTVKECLADVGYAFKILKISEEIYHVIRLEDDAFNKKHTIHQAIKSLGYFKPIEIDDKPEYIRSVVSAYNEKHGTIVRVRSYRGKVTLYKNIIDLKGPVSDTRAVSIKHELSEFIDSLNLIEDEDSPEDDLI